MGIPTLPESPSEIMGGPSKVQMNVRVDAYVKYLFKEQCKRLGLSTCFVLENLMRAWTTGEQREIPRARPITVNMRVDYRVKRPRRQLKETPVEYMTWPPSCEHADQFIKSIREVGCTSQKDWIPLRRCWRCWRRRHREG